MVTLLGDGLAGTLLTRELRKAGVSLDQRGDGNTNTPPVGFLHLFQGRTFHRDPVEVTAFQTAVEFWRAEPGCREWTASRTVKEGDRLHRSADTDTVPAEYRPKLIGQHRYLYGPSFTINSQAALMRWRSGPVGNRREPEGLDGIIIHATGLAIKELFPEWRWDINPGRTVKAKVDRQPEYLYLHKACHFGGDPDGTGITIGGRVSSKGEAKDDETILATEQLNQPVTEESEWWGKRIANALDRWPLVGWVDEENFLFCGFGGRALFWLPYCAAVAVEAFQCGSNAPIPPRLRADRLK